MLLTASMVTAWLSASHKHTYDIVCPHLEDAHIRFQDTVMLWCLLRNIAESRRRKAKSTDGAVRAEAKLVWIMPSRDRGRQQSTDDKPRGEAKACSVSPLAAPSVSNCRIASRLSSWPLIILLPHRMSGKPSFLTIKVYRTVIIIYSSPSLSWGASCVP